MTHTAQSIQTPAERPGQSQTPDARPGQSQTPAERPAEKLLTFVVPSYNMQNYLPINIQSVLQARRAADVEVLVVNDGSTDDTLQVARAWEQAYPGIVRVVSKPNGHYGSAVNCGIDHAQGRYLKLLDADDSVVASGLDALLEAIEQFPTTDLFVTDYVFASEGTEEPFSDVKCGPRAVALPEWEPFHFDEYLMDPLIMHSMCYRTELLRDPQLGTPGEGCGLRLHEGILFTDEEFATKPCALVDQVVYVPRAVYRYVVDRAGQSIDTAQLDRTMGDNYFVVKALLEWYQQLNPGLKARMSQNRRAYLETKIAAMMVVHVRRRMRSGLHEQNRPVVQELTQAMDQLPLSVCEPSLPMKLLRKSGFTGYEPLAKMYAHRHANEPI